MSWTNNSHDFDMREREMDRVERRRNIFPNDLTTAIEGSITLRAKSETSAVSPKTDEEIASASSQFTSQP